MRRSSLSLDDAAKRGRKNKNQRKERTELLPRQRRSQDPARKTRSSEKAGACRKIETCTFEFLVARGYYSQQVGRQKKKSTLS